MKKEVFLNCPKCAKEYYVMTELYLEQARDPQIKLICPYCHHEFYGKDAKFKED